MTKQDSAMEQHTSRQPTTGKTDSEHPTAALTVLPWWYPKELSEQERLRRLHKKYYGWKPCRLTTKELEQRIALAEANRTTAKRTKKLPASEAMPTLGDVVDKQ